MKQLKFDNLSKSQVQTARKFKDEHPDMTLSQVAKYLEYIFAYKRGEITAQKFKEETGWGATPFKKFQ